MRSIPSWCKGIVAGVAAWLLAFLGVTMLESFEGSLPNWMVVDAVGSICAVIAFPIMLGGWFFLWGDNGPPYAWMNSVWINVAVGITLCACIGVVVTKLIVWRWRRVAGVEGGSRSPR
jgi:hypothetical protein